MKKLLGVLVFCACSVAGFSQQDYQLSQFFNDKVSLNPAAAGMGDNCLGIFFREQWAGFSGNPTTFLVNYHQAVKQVGGGLGITVVSDRLGNQKLGQLTNEPGAGVDGHAITNTGIRLNYSYHFKLSNGAKLGVGAALGYQGVALGSDWYAVDGVLLDEAIPVNPESRGGFDMNLGVYYQAKKFWAGISSTHLTAQDFNGNLFDFSTARHYYFMTGYQTPVSSSGDLVLFPSALVKSDFVSTSVDVNARLEWKNMFWGGLGVRTGLDALTPMVGFNYEIPGSSTFKSSVRLGYGYDVTLSEIKGFSSGTHEINLGYCWKFVRPVIRKAHGNPRFL
ncbi:MAG: type IX secretion system membrane protein PorP/SprF [Flavobacteriales bacterium]